MRSAAAAAVVVACSVIVGLVVPAGTEFASGAAEGGNDFVFHVRPRSATMVGNEVAQPAVGGAYAYDVTVYRGNGAPFAFRDWAASYVTVDPAAGQSPAPLGDEDGTLLLRKTGENDGDNHVLVRVPSGGVAYGAAVPAHGVLFAFELRTDGADLDLVDPDSGVGPSGFFNAAANEAFEHARPAEADALDGDGTPLLLVNEQPAGLVYPGNPLLNPGFEVGSCVDGTCFARAPFVSPSADLGDSTTGDMALPPWYSTTMVGTSPTSEATQAIALGRVGHAARVGLQVEDVPLHYQLVQQLGNEALRTSPWSGASGAVVDVKFEPSGAPNGERLQVTIALVAFAGPNCPGGVICDDEGRAFQEQTFVLEPSAEWRTVRVDWTGTVIDAFGFPLESLRIKLKQAPATPGGPVGDVTVLLDDVALIGTNFAPHTSERELEAGLLDGMSVHVDPLGARLEDETVRLGWVQGTDPTEHWYLFNVHAIDYRDVAPKRLDLSAFDLADLELAFFDPASLVRLLTDADEPLDNVASHAFVRVTGASGFVHRYVEDAHAVLVAVPESALQEAGFASDRNVAVWAQLHFTPAYEDRLGVAHAQASGFYHLAKANVAGVGIADQFDPLFTTIELDRLQASTLVFETGFDLEVLDQAAGEARVTVESEATLVTTHAFEATGEATQLVRADKGVGAVIDLTGKDFSPSAGLFVALQPTPFSLGASDSLLAPLAVPTFSPPKPVPGTPIQFRHGTLDADQVVGPAAAAWSFGDGTTSAALEPVKAYASEGTFVGSVVVTDEDGLASPASPFVVPVGNSFPVADFVVATPNPQARLPIWFQSTSYDPDPAGAIVSSAWTFGDGGTSTLAWPTHVFQDDGVYMVSLTVRDDDGATSSVTKPVLISNRRPVAVLAPPEVASLGLAATTFLTGEPLLFDACASSDPDGTLVAFRFDYKVGVDALATSGDQAGCTALFAYEAPGRYVARVTVTDEDGATRTATRSVVVQPNQGPVAVAGEDVVLQVGDDGLVELSGEGSEDPDGRPLLSALWDLGGGLPPLDGLTVQHEYDTAVVAVHTATLTVTDTSGVTASASTRVFVDDRLVLDLSLVGDDAGNYGILGAPRVRACVTHASDAAPATELTVVLVVTLQGPGTATVPLPHVPAVLGTTGADGCVTVDVPPDLAGAGNIPGKHRVDGVVAGDSRPADALLDTESDDDFVQYTIAPRP